MEFIIGSVDKLDIKDAELGQLLQEVYVDAGYTPADIAETLFTSQAVRLRGEIIGARNAASTELAGIVIMVPPESPARKLAQSDEAEMHLLAVKDVFRGTGLGRRLVEAVLRSAQETGYKKMILWTQRSMVAAQGLYESCGFIYQKAFSANGYDFLLYEKEL